MASNLIRVSVLVVAHVGEIALLLGAVARQLLLRAASEEMLGAAIAKARVGTSRLQCNFLRRLLLFLPSSSCQL